MRQRLSDRPANVLALTTITMAALLSGCASLTSPLAPLPATPVPAHWSSQTGATQPTPTPLAQWWQRFNDPQLTALVLQALQANTSIRSAQAALQQSRALRDVKTADLLPSTLTRKYRNISTLQVSPSGIHRSGHASDRTEVERG